MTFIRYESPATNRRGGHTGIFGLANGLARSGELSRKDWTWWRSNNDWLDAAYPDPATVDPTLFDPATKRMPTCWFKSTADQVLSRVPGYLALLDRYGVAWIERRSLNPGAMLYEDDVQVVVAPHSR